MDSSSSLTSVWKFIIAIQKDNAEAHDNRNERGEPPQKQVKQSTRKLQKKLYTLCTAYSHGGKSIEELLKAIVHCIRF